MIQLGQSAQGLISTLAEKYDKTTPFEFAKLGIKDYFWSLAVSNIDV